MSDMVVDASALLAVLNQEVDVGHWSAAFKDAAISAVNLSEVVAKLADAGMPEGEIRSALDSLGLEVVPFDMGQAYRAGLLRPQTKAIGLSLGDRACMALAQARGSSVLTKDKAWTKVRIGLKVRVIG